LKADRRRGFLREMEKCPMEMIMMLAKISCNVFERSESKMMNFFRSDFTFCRPDYFFREGKMVWMKRSHLLVTTARALLKKPLALSAMSNR
jgi:hypothetical protein